MKDRYLSSLLFVFILLCLMVVAAWYWGVYTIDQVKEPAAIILPVVGLLFAGCTYYYNAWTERIKAQPSLSIEEKKLTFDRESVLTLYLKIKNTGQTAARDYIVTGSCLLADGPHFAPPLALNFPPSITVFPLTPILATQAWFEVSYRIFANQDEIQMIADGLKIFYFKGEVTYTDDFGQKHSFPINCAQGEPIFDKTRCISGWEVKIGHEAFRSVFM